MKMTWVSASFCFGLTLVGLSAVADQLSSDPAVLVSRIRKDGASSVVNSLWNTEAWPELTKKIASGSEAWIDAALLLSKGSDAGSTEDLQDALFLALRNNPIHVLSSLPLEGDETNPIALRRVCGGRTDPFGTYSAAMNEMTQAESAVRQVHLQSLHSKRQFCLSSLKDGSKNLRRFFAPAKKSP